MSVEVHYRRGEAPTDSDLASLLRLPGAHDHKYTRGVVGVWAGSEQYPGAAVLCASAAVRAGAGMVRLVAPRRVEDLVLSYRPEVVPGAGRCQALVIGPGTDPGDEERARDLVGAIRLAVDRRLPAVIDAGALGILPTVLSGLSADAAAPVSLTPYQILTPHAGEAATLLEALGQAWNRQGVEADPVRAAAVIVSCTGASVVLKGTPTIVASPIMAGAQGSDLACDCEDSRTFSDSRRSTAAPDVQGPVVTWSLDSGPGWLATAGSGDVLAGMMGTILASAQADDEACQAGGEPARRDRVQRRSGVDAPRCAALAVRLHALSGHRASRAGRDGTRWGGPIAALDVAEAAPRVIASLLYRTDRAEAEGREPHDYQIEGEIDDAG